MAFYDLRHGARLLGRSPVFTLVAITSLGAGLASACGLFTVINAMLFRALLGEGTEDVLRVNTSQSRGGIYGSSSYRDTEDFVDSSKDLIAGWCAWTPGGGNVTWATGAG
jgi:hypothetical protein